MQLLAPLWLIALIPWLGVAVWMLRGARESRRIPFLPLWRGMEVRPRTHRRMRMPPIAIALALLAALLAIVAAARPGFTASFILQDPVVLIIDRGLTMSARGANG
ncbi:MAG TPA: hypothetical protein VKP66_08375, partial [Steroidobacteraceae bacterium]|nr:hypothetical protein [Steroidobacteraceae bacterium]